MYIIKLGIVLVLFSLSEGKLQTCDRLLRELANYNSKFIVCAGESAAPVSLCLNCYPQYTDTHKAYSDLVNGKEGDNILCKNKYIDKDRLNIVELLNKHIDDLWNNAFCAECYNADGAQTNETQNIITLHTNFLKCNSTQDKHINICEKCEVPYKDLNAAYEAIKETIGNKICFDIQDFMNRTRSDWTKTCGHPKSTVSLAAFGAVSSVLSSIPILFYCGLIIYTRRIESNQPLLNEDLENEPDRRNRSSENVPNRTNEMNYNAHTEPIASSSGNAVNIPNTMKNVESSDLIDMDNEAL